MPGVAHFPNHVEVQISNHHCILIAGRLRDDLTARIAEVTLAIELADVPRLLVSNTIDGPDKVTIGNCVCRLFQLPKILRQARNCCRWIEDDLSAVQTEGASAFGKVPVIANVNADAREGRVECRITQIARTKIKLFP